jgi:hypothetical protein
MSGLRAPKRKRTPEAAIYAGGRNLRSGTGKEVGKGNPIQTFYDDVNNSVLCGGELVERGHFWRDALAVADYPLGSPMGPRLAFTRGVINPNRGPGSVTRVITR